MREDTIEAKYRLAIDQIVWFANVQLNQLGRAAGRKATPKRELELMTSAATQVVKTCLEHGVTLDIGLPSGTASPLREILERYSESAEAVSPESRRCYEVLKSVIYLWSQG